MQIVITYDNGKYSEFDTSAVASQLGQKVLVVEYELELDRITENGLWLKINHYDSGKFDPASTASQRASRKRGFRVQLANRDEVKGILRVFVDGTCILAKYGDGLIQILGVEHAALNHLHNAQALSLTAKIVDGHTYLQNLGIAEGDLEDTESIARILGITEQDLNLAITADMSQQRPVE